MTAEAIKLPQPASLFHYASATPGVAAANLDALSPYLLALMLRNVASAGFVFEDPARPGHFSQPGCIIASPSYPADTPGTDQDYVFNWVRDAAIAALEIAPAGLPRFAGVQHNLADYVRFAALCADNAAPTLAHACFSIDGQPRKWSEQSDGPALQTLALLAADDLLGPATQPISRALINRNVAFLLEVYKARTVSLWEEVAGFSFFARAVQLRCFRAIADNLIGLPRPEGLADAIAWLENALSQHWNGEIYVSVLSGVGETRSATGYDPNIDIVSAAIYGAVDCADPKLLATAGALRKQWADPNSPVYYPVNGEDAAKGLGPLLGRYYDDFYDGDVAHPVPGGHPWALCTANMAELYYKLAARIRATSAVPADPLAASFFAGVGVARDATPQHAAEVLSTSGDAMLRAIILHSDGYELGEQFDGRTGVAKSVRNLTWSYAAVLSALRARKAG